MTAARARFAASVYVTALIAQTVREFIHARTAPRCCRAPAPWGPDFNFAHLAEKPRTCGQKDFPGVKEPRLKNTPKIHHSCCRTSLTIYDRNCCLLRLCISGCAAGVKLQLLCFPSNCCASCLLCSACCAVFSSTWVQGARIAKEKALI